MGHCSCEESRKCRCGGQQLPAFSCSVPLQTPAHELYRAGEHIYYWSEGGGLDEGCWWKSTKSKYSWMFDSIYPNLKHTSCLHMSELSNRKHTNSWFESKGLFGKCFFYGKYRDREFLCVSRQCLPSLGCHHPDNKHCCTHTLTHILCLRRVRGWPNTRARERDVFSADRWSYSKYLYTVHACHTTLHTICVCSVCAVCVLGVVTHCRLQHFGSF